MSEYSVKLKKPESPAFQVPRALWPEGLTPFPFQLEGLVFLIARLSKHRAAYLAADPGLGKTISACLLTSAYRRSLATKPLKICYVCPPSLTANVQAEFEKWGHKNNMPIIVVDSKLAKATPIRADLAFVDEAHRFKNEKTYRTQGLLKLLSDVPHVVFLSGTPTPNNRPVELWTILKHFAPDVFGTQFWPYGKRYCGAHQVEIGHGRKRWQFDGFTNRAAFKKRLFDSFMCRQKKTLLDLPEKREGLLTVGETIPPILGKLEQKVLDTYTKEDLYTGKFIVQAGKTDLHLGEYMRMLGQEKLKHVLPFLEHLLLDTKENIIIFAHHRAVIESLSVALANFQPIVIAGHVPTKARHGLVQRFQSGKTRVAIMNIVAGGIGWNMTRADRVLFVEFSWRDGDNEQGGDRAHRIGRKNPVLVQYVVLKDSFDAKRMSIVLRKRQGAV